MFLKEGGTVQGDMGCRRRTTGLAVRKGTFRRSVRKSSLTVRSMKIVEELPKGNGESPIAWDI